MRYNGKYPHHCCIFLQERLAPVGSRASRALRVLRETRVGRERRDREDPRAVTAGRGCRASLELQDYPGHRELGETQVR
jgi:hypothetical protein